MHILLLFVAIGPILVVVVLGDAQSTDFNYAVVVMHHSRLACVENHDNFQHSLYMSYSQPE